MCLKVWLNIDGGAADSEITVGSFPPCMEILLLRTHLEDFEAVEASLEYYVHRCDVLDAHWQHRQHQNEDAGGDAPDDDDDDDEGEYDDTVHRRRLDIALHSVKFKAAALAMHSLVTKWLGHLENWSKTCPCHSQELLKHFDVTVSCPLCGCRAVDLATGQARAFLNELDASLEVDLLASLPARLGADESADIVAGWNASKQLLRSEWEVRTAPWMQLPLRALGMAHQNMRIVKEVLVDCLMQFDALDNPQSAHPMSKRLFMRGSSLRDQILDIICERKDFSGTPDLQLYRYAPHFIRTDESSIESKHAFVSKRVKFAPHHTEAYVSSHLRRQCILKTLRCAEWSDFLTIFDRVRTPGDCLVALGMQCHPCVEELQLAGRGLQQVSPSFAARIIYHNDSVVLYDRALDNAVA